MKMVWYYSPTQVQWYLGSLVILTIIKTASPLASFPGPAQLSVACSTEKHSFPFFVRAQGEPGNEATSPHFSKLHIPWTQFLLHVHSSSSASILGRGWRKSGRVMVWKVMTVEPAGLKWSHYVCSSSQCLNVLVYIILLILCLTSLRSGKFTKSHQPLYLQEGGWSFIVHYYWTPYTLDIQPVKVGVSWSGRWWQLSQQVLNEAGTDEKRNLHGLVNVGCGKCVNDVMSCNYCISCLSLCSVLYV